ncbi:MAG: efflux RND transporter periplasmic adaptor subunit [Pseudomonadota bacterium]|nr:efflux RND transporter periplasmic adaptor subunit [Pseudomonadota bacterium]
MSTPTHAPVLAVFLAAFLVTCAPSDATRSGAGGGAKSPVPVRVEVLVAAPAEDALSATGTVEAVNTAELRPEVAGLVEAVLFEDGDNVRRGQALVRLRDADAKAALTEARARMSLATLERDRRAPLVGGGDVSQAELDRAEAEVALAAAELARADEGLRRTVLVAPFDGVVGRRDVARGERIDPSIAITRIEGLAQLVVEVALPEAALASVAVGQPAVVRVDALPGRTFPGRVSYVAPRVAADTRTVDVRVAITEPDPLLRPGMTGAVRVVTLIRADAVRVPTQAVIRSAAGAAVYVVAPDGTATLRPIRTGERTEDRIEAVEGLAAGDSVVIEGLARLRSGAAVRVLADGEAAPASDPAPAPASAPPASR